MQGNYTAYIDEIQEGLELNEKKPVSISAAELQDADLPEVEFVIEGLVPHGLTILAAPPKQGKSWAVLDMALCVTRGRPFLGFETRQCGCLYLALEDSFSRLKQRMEKLLEGERAPEGFRMAIESPGINGGLFDTLEVELQANPDIELVIIDTLQKVRDAGGKHEGSYADDYKENGKLKSFADNNNIAILLVHHTRKSRDEDSFNMISGTNGIMGVADTAMVMLGGEGEDPHVTLRATGRDIESLDLTLRFDQEACRWRSLGTVDEVRTQRRQDEYREDKLVRLIKALLESSPEGWTGSAGKLLEDGERALGEKTGFEASDILKELKRLEPELLRYDGIQATRKSNGTGGGRYVLSYKEPRAKPVPVRSAPVQSPPVQDAPVHNALAWDEPVCEEPAQLQFEI